MRTGQIWCGARSSDWTEGTRTEPKTPQCKWPVHEGGVSLAAAMGEPGYTCLLPSRDVGHNLSERTNEWLLLETFIKKERSQPKRQHKVQTQFQKHCTAPTLLRQKATGQTRVGQELLGKVWRWRRRGWGARLRFRTHSRRASALWRKAQGLRERSQSVHIRETGKGKNLSEPWTGIRCICGTHGFTHMYTCAPM